MLKAKGLINFGNPPAEGIRYNCGECMQSLIGFGVRVLEGLFVLGLAGSGLVLVNVLIENVEIILGRFSDPEH